MAAVRQLAGERKGLGSGAQSARQANSLLANLQEPGVDRAALAAAAAAAAAAIRVVGAPSTPPPLAVGPGAPRGGCGRRRRWCNGRTKRGRPAPSEAPGDRVSESARAILGALFLP